jgi:hypothetical protein
MTKDEVLRMALDALENLFGTPPAKFGGDVAVWRIGGSSRSQQAIDAIKEVLAQPAPPPECKTEAEKTAFAFGWWKAMETKREWVNLTDEEIDECDWCQSERDYARSVERKLKEKNT